jgi:hypothetical protein
MEAKVNCRFEPSALTRFRQPALFSSAPLPPFSNASAGKWFTIFIFFQPTAEKNRRKISTCGAQTG